LTLGVTASSPPVSELTESAGEPLSQRPQQRQEVSQRIDRASRAVMVCSTLAICGET
jgi:hypothetical protein